MAVDVRLEAHASSSRPGRERRVGGAGDLDRDQPAVEVEVQDERLERGDAVGVLELVERDRVADLAVGERTIAPPESSLVTQISARLREPAPDTAG